MTIAADAEYSASAAAAVALVHAASRGAGDRSAGVREGRETGAGLDPVELARVEALSARDKAVRAHEAAHVRVAGRYAGAPSFSYETGPDGRRYAVAGRVRIDVSAVAGDPRATLDKMRVVRAAALAPADPSPADLEVAALAERVMRAARAELAAARLAEFARTGIPDRGTAGTAPGERDPPGRAAAERGDVSAGLAVQAQRLVAGVYARVALLAAPAPDRSLLA